MILDRVTITGADDSIDAGELLRLSMRYPFVEWGILFSKKHQGSPRYPSQTWLTRLRGLIDSMTHQPPQLAAHLCGFWVREFMTGKMTWWQEYPGLHKLFARVQLNYHGEPHPSAHLEIPRIGPQFILQADGVNDRWAIPFAKSAAEKVSILFDASGGAGLTPGIWPAMPREVGSAIYCGYAGGIGPDNVVAETERIALSNKDNESFSTLRYWIDMERRVRSADDTRFELQKVEAVLQAVAPFVASGLQNR